MAARALLALTLLLGAACGEESPAAGVSPAVTTPVPGAGTGGSGTPAAVGGAGSPSAGSGGMDAGVTAGTRAPDAGMVDAGPPKCRIPDDLMLMQDDADGGLAPDCYEVPRRIITENCIGYCHHSRGAPSGGLNLMSPCVADRLLDVRSRCEGIPYIDSANPEHSFILDKLQSDKPRCGASMPDGAHLPPNQVACMNAWVHAVVRASR
ncbi:MAG TPA: hypothetical protein VJR89_22150 [Polyangiales bacterium]|nr:hypothetical protein [Polyangiales bacterium]